MTGPRKRRWSLINDPCWNDGLAAQGVRSMWDMYIHSIRDDLGEGKYHDQVKKSKYNKACQQSLGSAWLAQDGSK